MTTDDNLQQRIENGQLTPEEMDNLRYNSQSQWQNCMEVWLETTNPDAVREFLAGPIEEVVEMIDWKMFRLVKATYQELDLVEVMEYLFPDYRDEMDGEDPEELSPEEILDFRKIMMDWLAKTVSEAENDQLDLF